MARTSRPDDLPPGWLSDEEFRADLARWGCGATHKRLENWRGAGLLPLPVQQATYVKGRVFGSTVWHSPLEARQALAIERALAANNRLDFAGSVLWLAGASVDQKYWRPKVAQASATVLRVRRAFRVVTSEKSNDENTFGERVKTPLGDLNGLFTKMARRFPAGQIPAAIDLVVGIATGQFEGFIAREPDEGDLTMEELAERALNLSAANDHRINGTGFNFNGLGAMLAEIAASIDSYSLDGFSDEDISAARDDVRNAFRLAVCFHSVMSWTYGQKAFGLQLASWMGRNASIKTYFALIVIFARLRRRSSQLFPTSQIAVLAQMAEAAWLTSSCFRDLQSIPQLAKSIEPNRWKSAFEDSHEIPNLLDEIAGCEFPLPDFQPWDQWKRLSGKTMQPGLLAMSIGAPNRVGAEAILHAVSGDPRP